MSTAVASWFVFTAYTKEWIWFWWQLLISVLVLVCVCACMWEIERERCARERDRASRNGAKRNGTESCALILSEQTICTCKFTWCFCMNALYFWLNAICNLYPPNVQCSVTSILSDTHTRFVLLFKYIYWKGAHPRSHKYTYTNAMRKKKSKIAKIMFLCEINMIMNKYFRFLTFHVKDALGKTLLLQQSSTHTHTSFYFCYCGCRMCCCCC